MSNPNELIIYVEGKPVGCTDAHTFDTLPERAATEPVTGKHEFTTQLDGSWVFDGGIDNTVKIVYMHTTDDKMHFVTQDFQIELIIPVQPGCEALKKGDLITLIGHF